MESGQTAVKLSNGLDFPLIGLGTSLSDSSEKGKLKDALRAAVDAGYRHFDTAAVYKTEQPIGQVLSEYVQDGRKRSDFFLATKLPSYANRPEVAEKALAQSLKDLQTDYIDLYLVHSPMSAKPNSTLDGQLNDENGLLIPDDVDLADTWRFMERAYKEGHVRAIGLSNFNEAQLQHIYDNAEIKPHVLQIELHVFLRQRSMIELCNKLGVRLTSYGPLCSPGRSFNKEGVPRVSCLDHPVTRELAAKYTKSPAQILLRYFTQHGIACIPKSVNSERIQQNISIFDFKLSNEDCQKFNSIKGEARLFSYAKMKHHPNYPY